MKYGIFFTIVFLLGIAVTYGYGNSRHIVPVQFNNHEFRIPQDSVLTDMPFWIRMTPGYFEDPEELLISIKAEDVNAAIPDYEIADGNRRGDLVILVKAMSRDEAAEFRDPNFPTYRDAWIGEGRYEIREIERHEPTGYYKVYNPNFPNHWTALSVRPDETEPIPANVYDFWVAECAFRDAPATQSGSITFCNTHAFFEDNIFFGFGANITNLPHHEEIKALIRSKLKSWETPKSNERSL